MFFTDEISAGVRSLLTVVLVSANGLLILAFLYVIVRQWWLDRDQSRKFALEQLAAHDLMPEGEFDEYEMRKVEADRRAGDILSGTLASSYASSHSASSSSSSGSDGESGSDFVGHELEDETVDMIPHHPVPSIGRQGNPVRAVEGDMRRAHSGRFSLGGDGSSNDQSDDGQDDSFASERGVAHANTNVAVDKKKKKTKSRYGPRDSDSDSWDEGEHNVFANIAHRVARTWGSEDGE